jgi:YD repeat-containing protein
MRELADIDKISTVIKVRRWKWIGHVLRSHSESHARTALTWTPEGRRKEGRPNETWRRTVDRVERTYPWPDSLHGERELSQIKIIGARSRFQ